MKLSEAKYGKLLNENYEDAFSLEKRFKFLNANIFSMLTEKEQTLMLEIGERCVKFFPKTLEHLEDIYVLFPDFAKMMRNFDTYTNEEIEASIKLQSILDICANMMCPELTWAVGASMLCIRSLLHNPNRSEVQEKAYQEMLSGTKVGGIGITEPLKGSDAVNMETIASIDYEKGTITYNGVKVFTTNGAVADYFTTYGVLDISNPRETMMLTLFKREDLGLSTERLRIPVGTVKS